MASTQSAGWQNPRILLVLFVVFLGGASVGAFVSMVVERRVHSSAAPQPAWKDGRQAAALERFRQELDLTPQQTEQLETILDDFFTYYHTLQAQLDDVRSSGQQKILRILDEKQKKKFEKLMSELRDRQRLR
ncbi:MAG: hypothetical protein ABSD56_03820 [Bryobacteraceae bacterium]